MARRKTRAELEVELQAVRTQLAAERELRVAEVRKSPLTQQTINNAAELTVLFDVLPVGVSILSHTRQLIYENPALTRILHMAPHELVRGDYSARRYINPNGMPMQPDDFASARAMAEQRQVTVETGVILEDGATVWVSVSAVPIHYADWAVIVVTTDITERMAVESALRDMQQTLRVSEERYRQAISAAKAVPYSLEYAAMTYTFMGEGIVDLTGYTAEEMTHPLYLSLVQKAIMHDEFAGVPYLEAADLVRAGDIRQWRIDHCIRTRAGELRWIGDSSVQIYDAAGSNIGSIGILQDITERKAMEQVLEQRVKERTAEIARLSQLQRAVLEHAGFAIITTDAQGLIGMVNPQAEQMLGYSAAEMIGGSLTQVLDIGEQLAERWRKTLGEAAPTRQLIVAFAQHLQEHSDTYEWSVRRKSGERIPVLLTLSALHSEEEPVIGFVGMAVDISARKQAEALLLDSALTLRQANAELERASRAKDEFLASMSHELRTPLSGILMLSESLLEQRRGPLNPYQVKSIERIAVSGQHLLELINDILDIAKIEAEKMELDLEPLVVQDVCKASLSLVTETAHNKGLTLELELAAPQLSIIADERRLKQILVNLLGNAVKFTPSGGKIWLHVQPDPVQGIIRFEVEDTGIGIAPEDQKRIFAPFVQVDSGLSRQFQGTGLGLSLVHKLVLLQGGKVEVTSEVGRGSRFAVLLPWQAHAAEPTIEAGPVVEALTARTHPLILLVEDDPLNRDIIAECLQDYGFLLIVAQDGIEAQVLAVEKNPALILVDIQMPGMDGLELTRRLRMQQQFATTPIVALTSMAMAGDRERCLAAGADEYLTKPISPKLLAHTLASFLQVV